MILMEAYKAKRMGLISSESLFYSSLGKQLQFSKSFNKWDENWEVGAIDFSTGQNNDNDTKRIRSKNYIKVVNATYYVQGARIAWFEYDANKDFIRAPGNYVGPGATFTPHDDAKYIRFQTATSYGNTYNNDICINISGDRNGEYEPYGTP